MNNLVVLEENSKIRMFQLICGCQVEIILMHEFIFLLIILVAFYFSQS
jgi:hypothetical protein